MGETNRASVRAACGRCQHFENDPGVLEETFPGFTSMGSGYASVRAQDGLCRHHGIYLSADDHCPSFLPVAARIKVP